MANQIHGVLSLSLIILSVLIALAALFLAAPLAGIVYLLTVLGASAIILFAYCAKCKSRRDACSHVFPGKAADLLPHRKQEPYTFSDVFATALSVAIIFLFPQYWLWQNKLLFIAFWVSAVIALVEIRLCVCKVCRNDICMFCPSRL